MKSEIKREKGVTMIALVITIVMLVILTNMLIYNAKDSVYIEKLNSLCNDIEMLRENILAYYNEYGEIPVSAEMKYTNITHLESVLSKNNDIEDEFYIIDLEAMENISLNYGRDYEEIKNNNVNNINTYTDIYIINKNSYNIFYVKGITIEANGMTSTYYTDYVEPDETVVDLKYIDGILIPDGYSYGGKNIDDSGNETIIIFNVINKKKYEWVKQISVIDKIPDSIVLSTEQDENIFIKSVNSYKGYFKNIENDQDVIYLPVNENEWSSKYTKDCQYKDENGDTATILKGFRVSMSPTMNTVVNGLVAKDDDDNEWVWIAVPKTIFRSMNSKDYDTIKEDLIIYTKDYRDDNFSDEYYNGCGIESAEKYTEMYNEMLSSIFTNGGFWISRYEIGDNTATVNNTTRNGGITGKASSKANQIPYNYVTCAQAQTLASGMVSNRTSSLLFGVQWDLVCKFLEGKSDLNKKDIKNDSTSWGNYSNNTLKITNTNARQYNTSIWQSINGIKPASPILLTTGASEQINKTNIYDFAGNVSEWTLERINTDNLICSYRGGSYKDNNSVASHNGSNSISSTFQNIRFPCSNLLIYKKLFFEESTIRLIPFLLQID